MVVWVCVQLMSLSCAPVNCREWILGLGAESPSGMGMPPVSH